MKNGKRGGKWKTGPVSRFLFPCSTFLIQSGEIVSNENAVAVDGEE
jgi:hypothetical protein